MFRDDLRNSVSRPVLAALAVLTMSTVALAAPQTGANKIELQEPSAKRVVLDSNDVSRIGVQTVPVREEKVFRRVVVLGKVEDEPTDNAATDAGNLAPAAATEIAQNDASSINDVQIRVLLDKNPADDADDDADQYDDEDDAEIVAPGDEDEDEVPVRAKRVLIQGPPHQTRSTSRSRVVPRACKLARVWVSGSPNREATPPRRSFPTPRSSTISLATHGCTRIPSRRSSLENGSRSNELTKIWRF